MTLRSRHGHLGRKPARHDLRSAFMIDFLHRVALPSPPPSRDWNDRLGIDLGMMANDKCGDCAFAGFGHAKMTWTSQRPSGPVVTPAQEVVKWYSDCTGYPATDDGVELIEALKYFRKRSFIDAYLKIDPTNLDHVRLGIDLFGGVYVGASLPLRIEEPNVVRWTAPQSMTGLDAFGSLGGHCMWCPTYDRSGFEFTTWGHRQSASNQWVVDYVDEMWVMVGPDWASETSVAPNGLDIAKLREYLQAL